MAWAGGRGGAVEPSNCLLRRGLSPMAIRGWGLSLAVERLLGIAQPFALRFGDSRDLVFAMGVNRRP